MSGTNHVELRNVTKQFGSQKAVNQVDLVLKAGESVGMAGTQRCRQIYHYEADTRPDYADQGRSDAFGRADRQ